MGQFSYTLYEVQLGPGAVLSLALRTTSLTSFKPSSDQRFKGLQGVARSCKESPETEHVKSQGPVLEHGDLAISLQPFTAQNNLYVTALLRPGTVLSTPAYKYTKMADFWSEEREENLIRLLEEQPVLYDVGSKGYSNRDSKKKACCDIAVALGVVF